MSEAARKLGEQILALSSNGKLTTAEVKRLRDEAAKTRADDAAFATMQSLATQIGLWVRSRGDRRAKARAEIERLAEQIGRIAKEQA